MREKVNASVSKTSAGRVHRTRHYRTSHYFSPQPLLRNSLQSSSSPSPGPLLLPAPQLLRVEVPQQPQPPVFCTVPKMSILYALIQIILSSLFIILFLKLADSPRTFSWKHVLSLRYFMKEPNNSTRCVKFQKSFPEIKKPRWATDKTGIPSRRPVCCRQRVDHLSIWWGSQFSIFLH